MKFFFFFMKRYDKKGNCFNEHMHKSLERDKANKTFSICNECPIKVPQIYR